jgi:hypothetical protein
MARTFRIILAGPDQDLVAILTAAEEPLANLGLRRSRLVMRADPEQPPEERTEEGVEVRSLTLQGRELADWKGAYVDWRCPAFSLGVQLARWSRGFLNAFVGIDRDELSRLYVEGVGQFVEALAVVAAACKAKGGLGATGLPFDPVPPDKVVQVFLDNPVNPGAPCPLGLFATSVLTRPAVQELAGDDYDIQELPGFWLLEDRDFVEISRMHA